MICVSLFSGCIESEGGLLHCIVGKNYTQPVVLPQAPITTLILECRVRNLLNRATRVPVYPLPTYTWKKDGIPLINDGEFTGEFYNLYPELMMINPFPVTILKDSMFAVSLDFFNTSGFDQVPVECFDHMVHVEWANYILLTIIGTWECVVENLCGDDTGTLFVRGEQGKACSEHFKNLL